MTGDDSEDSDSSASGGLDPEAAVAMQNALQPAMFEVMEQVNEMMNQVSQPMVFDELLEMSNMMDDLVVPMFEQDLFYTQEMVAATLQAPALQSALHTQKIFEEALQPVVFEEIAKMNQSLNAALMALNSPSIYADISSVSTTEESSETQSTEHEFEPATDVDEIWPPETRIHDKLVWDDGEWYREKATETAVTVVDYSFWKAKQGGELTDASDEEVSMGAFAAAFFVAMALSGNPIGWASAAFVLSEGVQKGARKRSNRKDLDEKFGEE